MKQVGIKEVGKYFGVFTDSEFQVSGYQIDSRLIEPGNLFFALKGERADGHRHLKDVAAKGAVGAVVSKEYEGPDFGLVLIPVEDVVSSLQGLARHFMKECQSKVIGITGSVGKTTTKEFLATILSGKYKVAKTYLNYNTKLTYPITLLNRDGDEDVLVVELGMTEPGDIERLINIAAPDIAIVTKIAFVHAANFKGDLFEIAKYKTEIFSHPKTKVCIFDHDLYEYPEIIDQTQKEKVSFSMEHQGADYFLSEEIFVDERGIRGYQFDPPYKQPHLLHNFLAALAAARIMKMDWDEINTQVSKLQLPKMRFERFEKDGIVFVNDAYNANPESMKAALSSIPEPEEGGKRIAVLGMMVDMGDDHETVHREIGRFAQKCVDHLIVFGKDAKPVFEAFQEVQKPAECYESLSALSKRLKNVMRPGDVVLVKASRCVEMEKLFNLL